MNRPLLWVIVAIILVAGLVLAFVAVKPMVKTRVGVRDDDGPVAGARIDLLGLLKRESGSTLTDASGVGEIRFQSFSGVFEYQAVKQGYYSSGYPLQIAQLHQRRLFNWEPWPTNTEILIRKIGKPVPMYVKAACARVTELGQPRGYDLMIGDWVAPYGSGRTNDFILELGRRVSSVETNETLRILFSNPGDGIQPIVVPARSQPQLRIPALAPNNGYRNRWVSGADSKDGENEVFNHIETPTQVNYYFRVRTKSGPDGQIVGGLYGKIYDGIMFDTSPDPRGHMSCTPGIYFTYFLNPDGTRNTEYSGQNLLQGEGTDVRHP